MNSSHPSRWKRKKRARRVSASRCRAVHRHPPGRRCNCRQGERQFLGLESSLRSRCPPAIADHEESGSTRGLSPLHRASAGCAVLELFPETKLGSGRPSKTASITTSSVTGPFSPEDLKKIEERMWEIQARDLPYERKYTKKDEGLKLYADQPMKVELITERAGEVFSEYTLGPHFIDFCRGPHVPSTKKIKAFKLLSVAGAYWKGDETQSAVAAHLRHCLFQQERSGRISRASSKKPRSATIASWGRSSTYSAFRNSPGPA